VLVEFSNEFDATENLVKNSMQVVHDHLINMSFHQAGYN